MTVLHGVGLGPLGDPTAGAGACLVRAHDAHGRPFSQDSSSALFILSKVWSKDWTLLTRLLPDRSRPPLPVYRNHSPSSLSSSYLHASTPQHMKPKTYVSPSWKMWHGTPQATLYLAQHIVHMMIQMTSRTPLHALPFSS